ncbi:MAG: prepilin-type N-terminal cleavage/methylation domain-containing protein [Actinomycetota bacterium]|nr:prepilin-type N-terminal cleavage/methylation domain-containing protein [Actinomycetota bacterium]
MSDERGFTLVEVLVAFFLLMVGMAGTALMLNTANATTAGTKAREQGIALQREVVEAARSIPYDELTPASVVPAIQAKPGLATISGDTSWKVSRGGVIYTLTMGACSVDDPSDGTGAHPENSGFCATGASTTTPDDCRQLLTLVASGQAFSTSGDAAFDVGNCGVDLDFDGTVDNLVEASVGICVLGCAAGTPPDSMPDDYKRIVSLVTWDRGTGGRYALQSTTVPNPGSASGVAVTGLTRSPDTAQIGSGTESVAFSATTSRPAATVVWSVNGASRDPGTGSGTAWSWNWPLGTVDQAGSVLDGSYLVGAKAFDANGVSGATRSMTVVVNRRAPSAPASFVAGRNGDAVEFEWASNQERDIERYRVYQGPAGGARTLVCEVTGATGCRQTPAPADLLDVGVDYHIVAVDKDAAGTLREGDPSSRKVRLALTAPAAPTGLTATLVDGAVTLNWTRSVSLEVESYRIYRDGQLYADRYDRVAGTENKYTDPRTDGASHTYWITAVSGRLRESTMAGPVTR